jgi:hypothetical protein
VLIHTSQIEADGVGLQLYMALAVAVVFALVAALSFGLPSCIAKACPPPPAPRLSAKITGLTQKFEVGPIF